MIKFDRAKDKIAIIAPASGIKDAQGQMDKILSFERLNETIDFFKQNGFECVYDEQIFTNGKLPYFASPKLERIGQLKNALEDPRVKIIHAFRGGYGCANIAFDCLGITPSGPKILIGFSDITVLHLLFNQHFKFPSIHGAMSNQNPEMFAEVISVIDGHDMQIELQNLGSNSPDSVTGNMIGGNLTVLCSMIGTKLHPNNKGKILFLEDVNEAAYRIHRNLVHMYEAGLFQDIKALIFGEFTNGGADADLTIDEFIKEYLPNLPVYKTNNIGHGKINYPIVIGGVGLIENDSLTVTSPFQLI